MQDLKISLITVCYNADATIRRCIESVASQNFKNIEYIIIDGASTDKTIDIIDKYKDHTSIFLSEPDDGIYDAMNKGIKLSSGDIVGMLNADDFFANDAVLSDVARVFTQQGAHIVYGNLDYINSRQKVVRKWRSDKYRPFVFNWGWMPPHPTFYCKRELFGKYGFYSLEYGSAADYELMLRFMHRNNLIVIFINKVLVKMNVGGKSNESYRNRLKSLYFDFKAMRKNEVLFPLFTIIAKPIRKIIQYLK
ncbi:MAG: glycosyltransferase family 2 protein [Sphingobacteriales bacterium]